MPTKTEQADLLQAMYGRNGESPVVIVAPSSPADCFQMAFEACRIAVEHMTPVIFLSDGYLANGSEPWRFPQAGDLPAIHAAFEPSREESDDPFLPYKRDERHVRSWAIPGTRGIEHRVGGLEKEHETGNVSYDPDNHQKMVHLRKAKVAAVANTIPEQTLDQGDESGELLVLSWGGTYGSVRTAVSELIKEGLNVSHAHLRYLNPFPRNLGEMLGRFEKIVVPEINDGQLVRLIRDQYERPAKGINKIKGRPFWVEELKEAIRLQHPSSMAEQANG